MKIKLTIDYIDPGTSSIEVPVRPRTQVAYERHFKTQLSDEMTMEGLYWLAWHASNEGVKFDTWLDTIDEVAAEAIDDDEDDESGPLAEAASSGTS